MLTLRRLLKYTPAILLGLLVVAWAVSFLRVFGVSFWAFDGRGQYLIRCRVSNFEFTYVDFFPPPQGFIWNHPRLKDSPLLGEAGLVWAEGPVGNRFGYLNVPITWPIVALLPLALGAFNHFRFRLWQYLAYTALVAAGLAYYLHWQQ